MPNPEPPQLPVVPKAEKPAHQTITIGPPRWPVTFDARWQRDWRLPGEVVDRGLLSMRDDGLLITGRRSNPLRAALYLRSRVAIWTMSLAIILATASTLTRNGRGVLTKTGHLS